MCPSCATPVEVAGSTIALPWRDPTLPTSHDVTDSAGGWLLANGFIGSFLALLNPNPEFLLMCLALCAAGAAFIALPRLASKLRRGPLAGAATRVDRDAPGVTPIREAPESLVRVRGRVRVLSAVARPDPKPRDTRRCGAYAWNGLGRFADPSALGGHCGRLAVVDTTGVAIIDDDCFVIEDHRVPFSSAAIRDGDLVEVVGVGRRMPAEDLTPIAVLGYRQARTALVFDGTPRRPIVLRALGVVAATPTSVADPSLGAFWL